MCRWGEIEPILKRATRYNGGRAEPIDLLQSAVRGELGFWLIENGAALLGVVTGKVVHWPRKREFQIDHIGGRRLAEWWPLFVDEMDKVARAAGCSGIFAFGRPGWVRFWKRYGVATQLASEIMVREL